MLDDAFPDHRRTGTGLLPLHPAGKRSQDALGAIGLGTAAAITAPHHAERPIALGVSLVQIFWNVVLICSDLRVATCSSSESRVNDAWRGLIVAGPTCPAGLEIVQSVLLCWGLRGRLLVLPALLSSRSGCLLDIRRGFKTVTRPDLRERDAKYSMATMLAKQFCHIHVAICRRRT